MGGIWADAKTCLSIVINKSFFVKQKNLSSAPDENISLPLMKKSWTRPWAPKIEIYLKCYYLSKNNEFKNLNFLKLNRLDVFIELESTHRDHESSPKNDRAERHDF